MITYEIWKAIKLQRCSRTRGCVFVCASREQLRQELTFQIAPYVFDLLQSGERDEISPICFIAVPLIARFLALDVDPSI